MSKLPFPTTIVTHALVETCVFGGLTYYLTGRISALEKRVTELEDLLLERLRKDNSKLNPRPLQPAVVPSGQHCEAIVPPPTEPLPQNPPPLTRQHAIIPQPVEHPIPIEIETIPDRLKAIDDEVEKEIAELNLS